MITKYNNFIKINEGLIEDRASHFNGRQWITYEDWEYKLDMYMKKNDFSNFSVVYNIGSPMRKEEYKNSRPQYKDIIDGVNIGLF